MTGTIYILRAGPYAKIGWVKSDVDARARQLQTGCPFPIEVARTLAGSRRQEAALHRLFSDLRAHGEWFHWSDGMATCEAPHTVARRASKPRVHQKTLLADWLRSECVSSIEFAGLCGVTKGTVSKWRSGQLKPSLALAGRIADVTDGAIPVEFWVSQ